MENTGRGGRGRTGPGNVRNVAVYSGGDKAVAMAEADDETALLARYAEGDPAAARLLAERLLPGILALARRMLRDETEAEDVAQETMLRLWKLAPDWQDGRARVSTWTWRVAANLCTDRLRRSRRWRPEADAPELADEAPGPEEALIGADRQAIVRAALEDLPDRQRLALHLRHFEELGNPQIAEVLETSVEAVESLLARARRTLARSLEAHRVDMGL